MATKAHRRSVLNVLTVYALFLLLLLPTLTLAQEEADPASPPESGMEENAPNEFTPEEEAPGDEGTTTEGVAELPPAPRTPPYKLESIPGGGDAIGDFVVGPGKVDVTINPGESRTVEMTVTNRTGKTRTFRLSVEDAVGSRDVSTSIVLLGNDRGPYSLKDYVTYESAEFELAHNQRARIPVTISIPADAQPGGLYGSVLAETVALEAVPGQPGTAAPQSAIVARIGTLFFVTVPGDIARDGALTEFGVIPDKLFYESGPMRFGILFENNGSMHLAPYGEIRITNTVGEEVGFVELEPWFALPNSLRLREVIWTREWLFGRYTATIQINRSYDDIIDTQTISFWVLPWKVVLGIFIGLFVFFFLLRLFFRTFEFKRK